MHFTPGRVAALVEGVPVLLLAMILPAEAGDPLALVDPPPAVAEVPGPTVEAAAVLTRADADEWVAAETQTVPPSWFLADGWDTLPPPPPRGRPGPVARSTDPAPVRAPDPPPAGDVAAVVRAIAAERGWAEGPEWEGLVYVLNAETTTWNPHAQNPGSSAYGLFQFLDGTWAQTGYAKTSDPGDQTRAGLAYIAARYGAPSAAAAHHRANGWY